MSPSTLGTLALAVALGASAGAEAQMPSAQRRAEIELTELLNAQAVTGPRRDQRLIDSPRQISVVPAQDIERRNYRSTPDALPDILGVYIQRTNGIELRHFDQTQSAGVNMQLTRSVGPRHVVTYGIDVHADWMTSRRM